MDCAFPCGDDVRNEFVLGSMCFGEAFKIEGKVYEAVPEDYELVKRFMTLHEDLLGQGKIRSHPTDVRLGIEGILGGGGGARVEGGED